MSYIAQATRGQLEIFNRARPLGDVIQDPRTPSRLKRLLSEIPSIKDFGERHGIKRTRNYETFVDLKRPAAVWVVSACEELKFGSKTWKFPIAGEFPYLGFFDAKQAQAFAAELRAEGWDVDVRGAGAYSLLGFFKDPVLSTMIDPDEEALGELVNVILHESVHATLYVDQQTPFNESLASFVADRLTLAYFDSKPRDATRDAEVAAYRKGRADWAIRERKLHDAYVALSRLYGSGRATDEVRSEKAKLLDALSTELAAGSTRPKRSINNATLVQYKLYNTGDRGFDGLLKRCGGDFGAFLKTLAPLKTRDFPKPQWVDFDAVVDRPCLR